MHRLKGLIEGLPNNSFNRSANSAAFMHETWMLDTLNARPVNSGVMPILYMPYNCDMKKKHCAYCGATNIKLEKEHVIPRSLYPTSKTGSKVQRLTVPACANCNRGWSDDEPHFRNILSVAGEPNQVLRELWNSSVNRSFEKEDGHRRVADLWELMRPVKVGAAERFAVYPATDQRFLRVLQKIVRGLHCHHGLWSPVPDSMVEADVLKYIVPQEFLEAMPFHHRESDVFKYQFEVFVDFEDIPMNSAWLLTFFENRKFVAWVRKPSVAHRPSA
jgi:hypothetical protein